MFLLICKISKLIKNWLKINKVVVIAKNVSKKFLTELKFKF